MCVGSQLGVKWTAEDEEQFSIFKVPSDHRWSLVTGHPGSGYDSSL